MSKFYGDAEITLRALFEKARETAPSIIYFDEIDALVPQRSSKQNQVHSSIVTTLLSLMDGILPILCSALFTHDNSADVVCHLPVILVMYVRMNIVCALRC